MVEPADVLRRDDQDGLGCPAEVQQLGTSMRRQREQRDRPRSEQGEHHDDELGDVRKLHDDPVTATDPLVGDERRRQPADASVEVAVGP